MIRSVFPIQFRLNVTFYTNVTSGESRQWNHGLAALGNTAEKTLSLLTVNFLKPDRRRHRLERRAYGELKSTGDDAQSSENGNDKAMTGHDSAEILAIKDNQIADLRSQLEKTDAQLQIATTEKTKLLDLLSAEKEEKRALMPPLEERKGWWQRLTGGKHALCFALFS